MQPSPLSALATRYLDVLVGRGLIVESTRRHYAGCLGQFARWLGDKPIGRVDRATVLGYMATRTHTTRKTQTKDLYLIRRFCDWLVVDGHLTANPAAGLSLSQPRVLHHGSLAPHFADFTLAMGTLGRWTDDTIYRSGKLFQRFDSFFGDRPVEEFGRSAVVEFLAANPQLSQGSRITYVSMIRRFGRWMVLEERILRDPTVGLQMGRMPRTVQRCLSATDIYKVIQACETDRERAIGWMLVGLGLRAVEVTRSTWSDYDETARTILIHGKGGNERLLPVITGVEQAIAAVREGRTRGPIIGHPRFPGAPVKVNALCAEFTPVLYRAGVKHCGGDRVALHALRRAAANDVLARSGDLLAVQAMLGHASVETTMEYIQRVDIEVLRKAMDGRDYASPIKPVRVPVTPPRVYMRKVRFRSRRAVGN